MSPVAFRLKALRTAAGLTQAQLADKAGVRQATVSELESGKGRRLLVVMDKLARALGVEPGELLERTAGRLGAHGRGKGRRSVRPPRGDGTG